MIRCDLRRKLELEAIAPPPSDAKFDLKPQPLMLKPVKCPKKI
jgi:hypothetical protein